MTTNRDTETRARLLKAAERLFADRGFKKVTVRDICRAARANVAAVNYHFNGKKGLYDEVVKSAIKTMQTTTDAIREAGAGRSGEEQVTAYYEHHVVWELMRQVDRRAVAIARELGVEQIDLMPVLERNFEIYYDELHHTPKGCEVVGREVARQILAPDSPTRPTRK